MVNGMSGLLTFSVLKLSRASRADVSSSPEKATDQLFDFSGVECNCSAVSPTCKPTRNAIPTTSTARGNRSVRELEEATATPASKPVQRPMIRLSGEGNAFESNCS